MCSARAARRAVHAHAQAQVLSVCVCMCMCSACAVHVHVHVHVQACCGTPLTAAKAVTHVRRPMLRSPIKQAMKGTSTAFRYSRKADLEAEVHWRPTS